ncbi:sugar ABC transporter permease, partial [Candidatus Bathyarchaeota archaeon]
KAIPKEYIEAAKVDGASEFNIFTRITLPLLRPIIVFVTSTNLMSCWFVFSSVYTLTKGGPGTATMVMGMYIYEQAFKRMKAGLATAAAIINTIVVLLIVIFIHLRGYRGGLYGR